MNLAVIREYNGNEYVREGRNGRLYTGIIGYRYYPLVDGEAVGDGDGYRTKAEATKVLMKFAQSAENNHAT